MLGRICFKTNRPQSYLYLLIIGFSFLIISPSPSLSSSLKSGSYFSAKHDVVDSAEELSYTEEIIYINIQDNTCQYLKERTIETKDSIPQLRTDEGAEFLKYIGKFNMNGNIIILNLTLKEVKNTAHLIGDNLTVKLIHEGNKLRVLNNNMTFQYVMK